MKKILLASLVLACLAATAHAAQGTYIQAEGGIGGMYSKKYSAQSSPTTSNPYDSVSIRSGKSYRFAVGYMRGMGSFSTGYEIGYGRYPNNTYNDAFNGGAQTYRGHYYDMLSVNKYSFGGFYVVAKAGVARITQEFTGVVAGSSANNTTSKVTPEAALGVGYDVTQKLGLDITDNYIFGEQADPNGTFSQATRISSINVIMGGLNYSFS